MRDLEVRAAFTPNTVQRTWDKLPACQYLVQAMVKLRYRLTSWKLIPRSLNGIAFTPRVILRIVRTLKLAAILCVIGSGACGSVVAQDKNQDPLAKEFAGAAPEQQPADAAKAAEQPAGAANNPPAAPAMPSNLLAWTYEALGPYYTIGFLAISITLLSLVVMCLLSVRMENFCPTDLIEGVEQQINEGNVQAAAEMVRSDESFLGQVLSAGLSKLDRGYDHAVEAMQEVGEEESMKLEHQMSYIAMIGSISPMVGLFGTVQGMIVTFQVIASATATPKPSELASGIATALFTTLVGLLIAIPAIVIFSVLRNRAQRLTLKVGVESENLLERFEAGK